MLCGRSRDPQCFRCNFGCLKPTQFQRGLVILQTFWARVKRWGILCTCTLESKQLHFFYLKPVRPSLMSSPCGAHLPVRNGLVNQVEFKVVWTNEIARLAMADLHNDITYEGGVKLQQWHVIENVWGFCTPPDKHRCNLWSTVALATVFAWIDHNRMFNWLTSL